MSNVANISCIKLSQKAIHSHGTTEIVDATRSNKSNTSIRILLDSASKANFVTQAACNKLGLKQKRWKLSRV